jgi:O-antigen/teichoic acid export membrane protein
MAQIDSDAAPRMERLVGIGITWKLAGQVAIQVVRLMTVAVLARLLTPHDYGAAAIAVALASFAPQLADMGIGSALVQADEAPRRVRSTAFWASCASGLAAFAVMAAAAEPVARFMGDPQIAGMVVAGGLTFAIYSIGSASQAVYVRDMKFRATEFRSWIALVTGGVIAIIAATAGAGPWALALQQIGYMSMLVAALWFHAGWRPTFEFSRSDFRQLGSFAIRIAGGRWARLLELLVLTVLIGGLASVRELGAWSFGMSMVILPLSLIAIPIAEVLFSAFSRLRDEHDRAVALWLDSVAYLAAVLLPGLLGLIVIAPDLIPAVFGARWEISVGVVQILSIYVLIRGLQSWGQIYLDAVGRPEVTFWTQLASLCLTPVAVVVGVHWGVEGVAACYVAAQLIAVEIPIFVIVVRQMGVSPGTVGKRLYGIGAASLVMAAACYAGRSALETLGVGIGARAALTTVLGMAVYAAALWFLAPHVSRRVAGICRRRLARLIGAGRGRTVLQPERG